MIYSWQRLVLPTGELISQLLVGENIICIFASGICEAGHFSTEQGGTGHGKRVCKLADPKIQQKYVNCYLEIFSAICVNGQNEKFSLIFLGVLKLGVKSLYSIIYS